MPVGKVYNHPVKILRLVKQTHAESGWVSTYLVKILDTCSDDKLIIYCSPERPTLVKREKAHMIARKHWLPTSTGNTIIATSLVPTKPKNACTVLYTKPRTLSEVQ